MRTVQRRLILRLFRLLSLFSSLNPCICGRGVLLRNFWPNKRLIILKPKPKWTISTVEMTMDFSTLLKNILTIWKSFTSRKKLAVTLLLMLMILLLAILAGCNLAETFKIQTPDTTIEYGFSGGDCFEE